MASRWAVAIVTVVLLVPSTGTAQTVAGAARVPGITVRRLPPAPQSGARPAETQVPPPAENLDLFLATPETYAPRFDRLPRFFHHQPTLQRGYSYGYVQDTYVAPPTVSAPLRQEGWPEASGAGVALDVPLHPPAVQRGTQTLYVIPRCYAGDTPPDAADLPAGCDIANLRRIRQP